MPATIVWLTGASSGIGRGLALALARNGSTVVATARRADELEHLAAEAKALRGHVHIEAGDVTDPARMEAIVRSVETTLGPIDTAVLNAGIYLPVRAEKFDAGRFRRSVDVNLMGTVNALAAVLPPMIARRRGRIAMTSSVAGYGGLPTSAAYGMTKAGLINLAASLKFDLDRHGIVVQVIAPGFVDTPLTEKNPFPMPFLVPLDRAVARIMAGLASNRFEISFPRRFTFLLKAINLLPYRLYFPLVARATGWSRKQAS